MTCKECIHQELCADYVSALAEIQNADVEYISQWLDEIEGRKNQTDNACEFFADRSRFVELPFKFDKGASPFDKIAHETYIHGVEGKCLAKKVYGGFYVYYNEERLYTVEKNGVVSLVIAGNPSEAIQKILNAFCVEGA